MAGSNYIFSLSLSKDKTSIVVKASDSLKASEVWAWHSKVET